MPSEARETLSRADALLQHAHVSVEDWLERALPAREAPPRRLHCAMRDAVFRGARRARPVLCQLVAELYGPGDDELRGRFAAAIELVHCASLVQKDLPCFDDTAARRGQTSCHVVYGAATAILVGDALLTLAFDTLANAPAASAATAFRLMGLLASATGGAHGVIGGQPAALFRAAAAGGAILGGAGGGDDVARWARLGELVGTSSSGAGTDDTAAVLAAVRALCPAPSPARTALQRLVAEIGARPGDASAPRRPARTSTPSASAPARQS